MKFTTIGFLIALVFVFTEPKSAFAIVAVAPDLGTASSFSVFAGSAMTADGSGATVSGDLGLNPGLSVTGPWIVGGTSYFGTVGLIGTVKTDATNAWTFMNPTNQPLGTAWDPTVDLTPVEGLYTRSGDATISGTLTLNGDASSVWIFQINNDLTFTDAATVVLGPGVDACNVFWQIDRDATINGSPTTQFVGTLIANSNVSLVTGATIVGRVMALTGTLSTTGVTDISGCGTPIVPPQLTLNKVLIGGLSNESEWTLTADGGATTISGPGADGSTDVVSDGTFQAGTYNLSESTGPSNYTASSWSCVINSGASVLGASVILDWGDVAVCTITNSYVSVNATGSSHQPRVSIQTFVASTTPVFIAPPYFNIPTFPKTGFAPDERYVQNNFITKFFGIKLKEIIPKSIFKEQVGLKSSMRLKIPKIEVDARIESVGLDADGSMGSPKGPKNAGLYNRGPRPGETGSSVIGGHFGWKDGVPAVFDNLHKLEKGDKIYVEDDEGTNSVFIVREVRSYDSNDDASAVFSSADEGSYLNLITCEGVWNKLSKSYSGRLVVFADKEV